MPTKNRTPKKKPIDKYEHKGKKRIILPSEIGDNRRIAVKIVDYRGIESLKITENE